MERNSSSIAGVFPPTQWERVELLRQGGLPAARRRELLEELCRDYREPLRLCVLRRGFSEEDADDLVQAFVLRHFIQESSLLATADSRVHSLRARLRTGIDRFLTDELRRRGAEKRGANAPAAPPTPAVSSPVSDHVFDLDWARCLLERALHRLRAALVLPPPRFAHLLRATLDGPPATGETLAAALGTGGGHARVILLRFRREFAAALRREIAATVPDAAQVAEEFRYLMEILVRHSGGPPAAG